MKTFLKAFILILIPSLAVLVNPPASVEATMMQKEMNNHLGRKVIVNGTTKATASWLPVDGAASYHVYFKICGNSKHEGALRVTDKGLSVEIGYLNGSKRYCYNAVPVINGKEAWEKAPEKSLYSPKSVLGTTSYNNSSFNQNTYVNPAYQRQLAENVGGRVMQEPSTLGVTTVAPQTSAVVRWENVYKSQTSKVHVYYWTSQSDKHAVRNLPGNSNEVKINYLNPTAAYKYSVQAILHNGKTVMLVNEAVLKAAAQSAAVQGVTNVYQPYQYNNPNFPDNYQY